MFWTITATPSRPRFQTLDELAADVQRAAAGERAELIADVETTLARINRTLGPTRASNTCTACGRHKADHYSTCACGFSLYAVEARARADAAQYGVEPYRDECGVPVEFSHHNGQVMGVR